MTKVGVESFIGAVTGALPHERVFGTIAICALAVAQGVSILRVHDVAASREAVRVAERVMGA